jgi:hypothetical protein
MAGINRVEHRRDEGLRLAGHPRRTSGIGRAIGQKCVANRLVLLVEIGDELDARRNDRVEDDAGRLGRKELEVTLSPVRSIRNAVDEDVLLRRARSFDERGEIPGGVGRREIGERRPALLLELGEATRPFGWRDERAFVGCFALVLGATEPRRMSDPAMFERIEIEARQTHRELGIETGEDIG